MGDVSRAKRCTRGSSQRATLKRPSTSFTRFNRFSGSLCRRERHRARRTEKMKEERRLVRRVLRYWTEISDSGRFPRRDQIDRWMRGEDGAN